METEPKLKGRWNNVEAIKFISRPKLCKVGHRACLLGILICTVFHKQLIVFLDFFFCKYSSCIIPWTDAAQSKCYSSIALEDLDRSIPSSVSSFLAAIELELLMKRMQTSLAGTNQTSKTCPSEHLAYWRRQIVQIWKLCFVPGISPYTKMFSSCSSSVLR